MPDIKIFCTAFIVQREVGGNLIEILAGLAGTIRERFKLKMQVRALTAEGRVTAVIIGLIPVAFAVMTYIFNPEYIQLLFVHPLGRKLLLVALAMEGLGFYLMRRLASIDA
jgi:tight adherence protein B